jgi:hypothetical protein
MKINKYTKPLILFITLLIIIIVITYFYLLNLLCYKLHEVQTTQWISDLTDVMILGLNNRQLYSKINRDATNISFWYVYWFFKTNNETIWILANMRNKFSSLIQFNIYKYNTETNQLLTEIVKIDMNDIVVMKNNNTLTLKLKDIYEQNINFIEKTSSIKVSTNKFKMFFNLSITDCNTNQASFVPPVHNILSNFVNVKGIQTGTPGEWFSDNPYIGKIINGVINGEQVHNGNYWFDNFIACNNGFLTSYTWFVVLNDDWLIYLLWFGDQDTHNNPESLKPILIKNNKEDRMIYSGIIGTLPEIQNRVEMKYTTSKKMGDDNYDDYRLHFNSDEIQIEITSNKNTCKKVHEFYYYKDNETNIKFNNEWDKQYYNVLNNLMFVEYVVFVDVDIIYKGVNYNFKERQVIDAMYRVDETIPRTINW